MTIEEIKSIYKTVLELNQKINSSLNNFPTSGYDGFNEEFQKLLDMKGEFLEKLFSLIKNHREEFEKIKNTDLKETLEQISALEQENIKLIKEKQTFLSQEINKTNNSLKALSAYKFNKDTKPRIFDEKD